jgi:hypothetical protein
MAAGCGGRAGAGVPPRLGAQGRGSVTGMSMGMGMGGGPRLVPCGTGCQWRAWGPRWQPGPGPGSSVATQRPLGSRGLDTRRMRTVVLRRRRTAESPGLFATSSPLALRRVPLYAPWYTQKSDLRNHLAIAQPRLYDCLVVTQITVTLKTEGPHGLPSGRLPAEVDPPDGEVLFHLSRLGLRCGQRLSLERSEPCANAAARERGEWGVPTTPWPGTTYQPASVLASRPSSWQLFRKSVPGRNRTRGDLPF